MRGIHRDIPFLFEKDRKLIELANRYKLEFVGLSFVRSAGDRYRPQAEPGAHDDCVMALAIAHYLRPRQTMAAGRRRAEWTRDMWEDYAAADKEGRAYLEQKWGRP